MYNNIGIFGGEFDPPHTGHLILADQARQQFELDKIIWIPGNLPPHRPAPTASAKDRFKMVELAVSDNPYFESSDLEIKRGGISYTIDTLRELRETPNANQANIFLIIGLDEALSFHKWKNYKDVVEIATLIVAGRPGINHAFPKNTRILQLAIDISSSKIRELIKQKLSIKYLAPDKVVNYIKRNKLYT